jgi:3-oxoacyl-[acyl-carrier-protein] synthase-3
MHGKNEMLDKGAPRIRSIGVCLPSRRESNWDKAEPLGFTREFLEQKLGVVERAVKEPGETGTDLALKSVSDLQQRSGLSLDQIQLLVVVTQHPEYKVPHSAALVHNRLGLSKQCMTFDVSQGCAGYTHAVTVVTGVMDSARLDHAILITCDPYSDKVDPQDKDTALLFGDAATATYFARSGLGYRIVDSNFGTLPNSYQCLMFREVLEMNGSSVFKHAVQEAPPSLRELLRRNELTADNIDLFLLHQGSKYLVEYVARKMGVPIEKAPFEAAHYGNTVSSSIPLMLQPHVDRCHLSRIMLSAFGVGFTWGNNLLERTGP